MDKNVFMENSGWELIVDIHYEVSGHICPFFSSKILRSLLYLIYKTLKIVL